MSTQDHQPPTYRAAAPEVQTPQDATDPHELPWGALVLTIAFLILITVLWIQVYLDLLSRGVF
jgi:hypothetical protein